ncbi:MAG: DedA family protein [Acidithiobacillus ferriphilus]|uniref:DedA family protein n=1 Tax=Acidithiobacillus ferriphilus TaxID=1689834 RepID=UPI001C075028|nr:DedA family protein [Acidithiobacillus ferriphilus]
MNIPPFLLSATHAALPIIHRYGLWVISGALFLDSFGVIFMPGESILVAAGFLARYGALSIWLLIPMTVIAATLGNYGAYGLGSRFSHLIPLRWGRWIGITAPRLENTACFFKRHGPVAVMLGRFIVPLRQLQGYVAGSAKMGFWRFAWWSLLGAMAWVLVWGLVGWWVAGYVPLA